MVDLAHGELGPGHTVGPYRIIRRLGSGGMGEVYQAVHEGLNKTVAVKVLHRHFAEDPTIVERFMREGQAASRIRHPGVVDVNDVGVIDGIPCLVMEYVEGDSLREVFRKSGAMDVEPLADLMVAVCAAVDAAHRHGVVHRDLKPPNVLVSVGLAGDFQPKVLDFGISKLLDQAHSHDLTADSTFLGSPHYASPEAAKSDRGIDGRADQYSIGVMLYEGATGQRPFATRADTLMTLMLAITQGDFPPPRSVRPSVPEAFEQVILRAMAREREHRYPSTAALGSALLPFASARARVIWEPILTRANAQRPAPVDLGPPSQEGALEQSGTLARSASALNGPRSSRRNRGPLLLGVAAALGLALIATSATLLVRRSSEPAAESPKTYRVVVTVQPDTATLDLNGQRVGTGRLDRELTSDGSRHLLKVSAPGHESMSVLFDHRAPPPSTITLSPLPAVAPTVTVEVEEPPTTDETAAAPKTPPRPRSPRPNAPPKASPEATTKTDNRDPWAE